MTKPGGFQIIGAPDYCRKRKRTPSSALFLNLQTISTTSINHNTMLKASELQSSSYPEASSSVTQSQPSALNNSTSSDQSKQQDSQRSRDGLRLNFHRSISEPQGQRWESNFYIITYLYAFLLLRSIHLVWPRGWQNAFILISVELISFELLTYCRGQGEGEKKGPKIAAVLNVWSHKKIESEGKWCLLFSCKV